MIYNNRKNKCDNNFDFLSHKLELKLLHEIKNEIFKKFFKLKKKF